MRLNVGTAIAMDVRRRNGPGKNGVVDARAKPAVMTFASLGVFWVAKRD